MLNELSTILLAFSPCFSRVAAFQWFVVIILGLIVRLDFHVVTSFVRWLALDPEHSCMVILDAYFAVGPTFLIARECVDKDGRRLLHVITRAKDNAVGYEGPQETTQQRKKGRPPVWGKGVKLWEQFTLRSEDFQTSTLSLYGKRVTLSYLCLDLVWNPVNTTA